MSSVVVPDENLIQSIKYAGPESEFVTELLGQTVNIQCSEGIHNHGSSKVKLADRIDYNWEFKYYHGHLVAADITGKIIAYAMKGKEGGMIRVTDQETNAKRTLIKNFKEDIKDLSFSYSREEIILGCIDCEGNILVYQIVDDGDTLSYKQLLHIYHVEHVRPKVNFRLIWCPYLPSYDEDTDAGDDPEKMFVVLNGTRAEIYNLTMLTSKYGSGTLDPNDTYEGYIEINHSSELVDASFSSDGTAIAIACLDGYVKFFQLYMFDDEKQKCLHEWQPHNGQPLTSIIFIDNVLEYSSEYVVVSSLRQVVICTFRCWKFAITGANNNSEIKLWSCETWTCLQTIYFVPNPKNIIQDLFLTVSIDHTGQFLVVADINNRALYIMQLKRNDEEQVVCVTVLSQFLLPAPFLSFHVLDACTKNIPLCYSNSTEDVYDNEDLFDEDSEITVTSLKMLVIQPKKFQDCNITFQPESLMRGGVSVLEKLTDPLFELRNGKKDDEEEVEKIPELDDLQSSVSLLIQQQEQQMSSKLTLMTPDDFTSAGKNSSRSSSVRNSLTNDAALCEPMQKLNEELISELHKPPKDTFASAGSSPSREVQEILSLNNSGSNYGTDEYFNNLANLQVKDEQEVPEKDYSESGDPVGYQDPVNWPKIPVVNEDVVNKSSDMNSQDMETVYFKISALEGVIREQSLLIQQLHQDMKVVTQSATRNNHKDIDKEELIKELDCAMAKQHLQIAKMLENLINLQKNKDRDLHDQLVGAVGQLLSKSLAEKLQHEMKHSMLPTVHALADSYRHQVDDQYTQKFADIDKMVKENFAKVINSKSLTDSISLSVVNLVSPTLEKCYRDIISSSLLPSWERICGQMFQQINETFTKGTKEYTASVENYMDRQRKVQDKGKDMMVQMQTISDSMKANSEALTSVLCGEIHKQFSAALKSVQDKLVQKIKETVSVEVKQSFKNHAAILEDSVINAVRSRAVTPAPHADSHVGNTIRERIDRMTTLSHIQQCINRGEYDEAFQMALSAENLTYVIFVCERVDVGKVFGESCALSQSVLLALIQQLSMELHKDTETKLSFIRAAFLALTPEYPQTRQFVPNVLRDLLKQLSLFMQTSPPLKQMTDARLLKMAVERMLSK
ncbi:enhancer of mRNA-decapping protein 4 isoform X3 [Cylas formicarius]|uniref:enhancer of mRNA-decapping protein 4 isoform X3 n=1 Tax=Cylas formicarius TaxID=197179 RepID=UPI0029587F1D|nr:enhancer of mRNA-decapping protein 4 isoform X3 [Cylas formicarius]